MTAAGYSLSRMKPTYIKDMLMFRKPGLPILMVTVSGWRRNDRIGIHFTRRSTIQPVSGTDGSGYPVSRKVWDFTGETLAKIASWWRKCIVAAGRFLPDAPKAPGREDIQNETGDTGELLEADQNGMQNRMSLALLPEIHAAYEEHIYQTVKQRKDSMTFLISFYFQA
ncbi:MAG: hypothetical protein ACLUD0_12565 [Eubacterium ramulus]